MSTFLWLSKVLLCSRSVVSDSLLPHGLQHARFLCPSPSPRACSNKGVSASLPKFCLNNKQSQICSGLIPSPLPLFFPSSPPCLLYPPTLLPLLPLLLFLPLSPPFPPPLPLAPREGRKGIARVTNFRRTNWSCLERKRWQVMRSTSEGIQTQGGWRKFVWLYEHAEK